MALIESAGAVLYTEDGGVRQYVLVMEKNGSFGLPKGHVEPGETEEQTALREIKEETGIDVELNTSFREVVSYSPKRDTTKDVIYFLGKAKTFQYTPQEEEIAQIKWVEINLAHSFLTYDNDKQLVNKAKPMIRDLY